MSLYNLAYQQYRRKKTDGSIWPNLWVLCDGKDKNHTAYLSASFRSTKQTYTQASFLSNCYSTGDLHPDEKYDRYVAAGYVITSEGAVNCFTFQLVVVK